MESKSALASIGIAVPTEEAGEVTGPVVVAVDVEDEE